METSRGGKSGYLSRALDSHVRIIQETFEMLEKPAASSLEKVDWSQVIKLGDEITKQATVAGMLWTGEKPGVKDLEANMQAYFNVLHGFLLGCHGSTVDAGPTLHASIQSSAKQVIDCSLSLLRESVSSCESPNSNRKLSIPQLSGAVWEACASLKKTPTNNCTAIGRAITQVAVSVKDVIREMKELKPMKSADLSDDTHDDNNDLEDDSSDCDLGDDLSPEEMGIAQLATDVVSEALVVMKEIIRFITGLLRKSNRDCTTKEFIDTLEKVLVHCQDIGAQVNELGACVYPPQEVSQMKLTMKTINYRLDSICREVVSFDGSVESLCGSFQGLENSLEKLGSKLGCSVDDLARGMTRVVV